MTQLYIKIFLTFWLITTAIILGTNVVVHWFAITPDGSLQNAHLKHSEEPAKRLLFQMAGSMINRTQNEIRTDMRELPAWSIHFIFTLDQNDEDLLHRPLPPGVGILSEKLTSKHPYEKIQDRNRKLFGRYITLNDGNSIKLITISDGTDDGPDRDIIWELFINNIWPLLLVSILISGSACFLLARHFTRSIKHLQKTIQQVSDGNLDARASTYFTGRKDEIAQLGFEFDQMTARLQQAMQEQKRLIKDVSHELRSPLARLQFALALAQERSQGVVDVELAKIKLAADYLNHIITEILSLPVHEQAGIALEDTLDLHQLLSSIIEDYAHMAKEKNIQLNLHTECDEALVATHGNMLIGVFENTLRNAIHYSPHNSGIDLTLRYQAENNSYITTIKDCGPGVPHDLLDDIFKPFFRTDSARNRESGGYGLGLAIAHRSVVLHHGNISAKNNTQEGLTITVVLPAKKTDEPHEVIA